MRHFFSVLLMISLTQGKVVVNEIHYHPVEEPAFDENYFPVLDLSEDVHEFIELYNSSEVAVSLAGWQFTDGVQFLFPSAALIPANGYVVVAKNPRALRGIAEYHALTEENVFGPWSGKLRNSGERIILQNAAGEEVDRITYGSEFPWPGMANGFGANVGWTGMDPLNFQYRGSSLERVSVSYESEAPENWVASLPAANPSPGKENLLVAEVPAPVVLWVSLAETESGEKMVRPSQPATVRCAFSSFTGLGRVYLDYFIDDLEREDEAVVSRAMVQKQQGAKEFYEGEIPAQLAGRVVRYRIRTERGEELPILAPRADDPFSWYAYSPWEGSVNYEIFLASEKRSALSFNLTTYDPLRLPPGGDFGPSRSQGWNGTEGGIFIHQGQVWDVQLRFQGSPYTRWLAPFGSNVPRLKIKFPRYQRFNGRRAILLTRKDVKTLNAHRIFRFAGLPLSEAKRVTARYNLGPAESMVEIAEMDEAMLEEYHEREFLRSQTILPDDPGWIVKSSGLFQDNGPWGVGNGSPMVERNGYRALERYSWTYPTKNQDWRGYLPFQQLLATHPGQFASASVLENYFNDQWEVEMSLKYYAIAEWMGIWDDEVHNYFYYRNPDGKWAILPWDFDDVFSTNPGDSHVFGPTIKLAFPTAYEDCLYDLNNTLLSKERLIAEGITQEAFQFAETRQVAINTQLGRNGYARPQQPFLLFPFAGEGHDVSAPFETGSYLHPLGKAHAATVWEFSMNEDDFLKPVYRVESNTALTKLTLPREILREGERYYWRVQFIDSDGHVSHLSSANAFTAGAASDTSGFLRISEVVAHNSATTEHDGAFPDWVEITEPFGFPQSLTGVSIRSRMNGPKFTFPEGATIPASGKIIIWMAEPPAGATGYYSGFGLSKKGDTVELLDAEGRRDDAVSFGPQADRYSLSRSLTGNWELGLPTPGGDHEAANLGSSDQVRISEWYADSLNGEEDWLEITNTGMLPVVLTGLTLEDETGQRTGFPQFSYLAGGEYFQLIADGEITKGWEHLAFSLSRREEEIRLRDGSGALVDQISFWNQQEGVSEGWAPDFSMILPFVNPSPGERNVVPDTDGDGMPDVWEGLFGLDANNPADASTDADGDGFGNFEEYLFLTQPDDAGSFFAPQIERVGGLSYVLSFLRNAGRNYTLEKLSNEGSWEAEVFMAAEDKEFEEEHLLLDGGNSVYRVRVSLP